MRILRALSRAAGAAAFVILAMHASTNANAADAIETHSATVNGFRLSYLQAGHGPETPVVLLHGYAETSHMWLPLIPKLAGRRIVIAPDLRGAGSSEKPTGGYDKKTMAQDIHALVQSLGYSKVK